MILSGLCKEGKLRHPLPLSWEGILPFLKKAVQHNAAPG